VIILVGHAAGMETDYIIKNEKKYFHETSPTNINKKTFYRVKYVNKGNKNKGIKRGYSI
jgi:hypothetical protein